MKHCKNCGKQVHDSFCSHCGQKVKLERVTFSYLYHEVLHFFTHLEKGFFFTSYQMIVRPGQTVRAFLGGKRKQFQSPVSYFLIWITIYILFLFGLEKIFGENVVIDYADYYGKGSTTKFAISHLAWVLFILVPFQALFIYLVVTRKTYYYFETMVASFYNIGTVILFQMLFSVIALLSYFFFRTQFDLGISDIFKILYLGWFTFDFTKLFDNRFKILRGIVVLVLAFGAFTVWRMYGVPEVLRLIGR